MIYPHSPLGRVAAWRVPSGVFHGVSVSLFDLFYPMAQIPTGADDMTPLGHREHAQTVSPQNSEYGARYRPRADPSPSPGQDEADTEAAGAQAAEEEA